jgi:multidrug efflux pump subunit AcrA (membrane-fusion protein)
VEEIKDATLPPLGAFREQDGKFLVEVKGPQGFVTREVKLGIRSHTHVAVLEGLKPDEEVRLF